VYAGINITFLFRREDNEPEEPEEEEDEEEDLEPELEDDDEDEGEDNQPEVTVEEASGLKLKLKKSVNNEEVFKHPGTGSRKRARGSEDAGRARKRSSRRGTSAEVYLSNLLEECFRAAYTLEEVMNNIHL